MLESVAMPSKMPRFLCPKKKLFEGEERRRNMSLSMKLPLMSSTPATSKTMLAKFAKTKPRG